ncbi:GNAT family N-acetyltransferase [Alkalihalobacterium elongatum]|uniref:GNAT family N-acetyltransferase n=1 Tax=Alkalihalobacterium elongatum TaxID=2675466 RepID=UPI001C1FA48C|nr:N-acetyltransferase [Alkalihalobacterium elongatum]
MEDYKLVTDYKHNEALRASFNRLAKNTFGIDFERWYQKGYWNDRYICYSYVKEKQIIANVSVNLMDLVVDGKPKCAIQISTVMIDPHFRNQGLSKNLMDHVLEKYEGITDLIFLFANQSVLDFYPKFGFKRISESQFEIEVGNEFAQRGVPLQKLDPYNTENMKKILNTYREKTFLSKKIDAKNAEHLLTFYCLYVLPNDIYYIEELDTIIMYKLENNQLNLYNIVSINEVSFQDILPHINMNQVDKVKFQFTPSFMDIEPKVSPFKTNDDVLFIKSKEDVLTGAFKFPLIAHA